ncbi:MAG: HD-GYP domain-containing protein [Phycisphaeraceae bacterium]
MVVAASVMHPRRDRTELLSPGFSLDARTIKRLKQLEVRRLWVHHDAAADLDAILDPGMGGCRRRIGEALKDNFSQMSQQTLTVSGVVGMRQLVMELICELTANRKLAALTEQMIGVGGDLFVHGSSVAYLSIVLGLELETYIVQQRNRMDCERARDLTGLGLGAMLHDIGKLAPPTSAASQPNRETPDTGEGENQGDADDTNIDIGRLHLCDVDPDQLERLAKRRGAIRRYLEHPRRGYDMLRDKRAPASATQVVLTHHRLFDGRGFPEVGAKEQERHAGQKVGQGIHVFSRIAAAADTLDGLLRRHADKPPIAALHTVLGRSYEGWFDPVVRDTLVRRLPPFAIGSRVVLSDGRPAAVITPSMLQPCCPTVRLLGEADRNEDGSYPTIDLREQRNLAIAEAEGVDVTPWLFELAEEEPLAVTAAKKPISSVV